MTKTAEKKERTPETVEKELEGVRTRLEELRAELQRTPALSWDSASPEVLKDLAEAEQQRAVLPAAIAAGEVRELELELELVRARRPETQREIERLYDTWQKAEEKLREAQEKRNAANYAYGDALERDTDLKAEEHRLTKELFDRKAAAGRSSEALGAPLVRSLWQRRR